jgi:hypothetical protein
VFRSKFTNQLKYCDSMATVKVPLSLDQRPQTEGRKAVGAPGLSSFVSGACEHALQRDRIAKHLAELEERYGPLDPKLVDEVRELWPAPEAPA